MNTQETIKDLCRQSIAKNLTALETIKLFKSHGFKKNSRGKPWNKNSVGVQLWKARQAFKHEPPAVYVDETLDEGDAQNKRLLAVAKAVVICADQIAQILAR